MTDIFQAYALVLGALSTPILVHMLRASWRDGPGAVCRAEGCGDSCEAGLCTLSSAASSSAGSKVPPLHPPALQSPCGQQEMWELAHKLDCPFWWKSLEGGSRSRGIILRLVPLPGGRASLRAAPRQRQSGLGGQETEVLTPVLPY